MLFSVDFDGWFERIIYFVIELVDDFGLKVFCRSLDSYNFLNFT